MRNQAKIIPLRLSTRLCDFDDPSSTEQSCFERAQAHCLIEFYSCRSNTAHSIAPYQSDTSTRGQSETCIHNDSPLKFSIQLRPCFSGCHRRRENPFIHVAWAKEKRDKAQKARMYIRCPLWCILPSNIMERCDHGRKCQETDCGGPC